MKIIRTYQSLKDTYGTLEAFMSRCTLDTAQQPATDQQTKDLFNLLWLRYGNKTVSYTDEVYQNGELIETDMTDVDNLSDKINYIYSTTKDRYLYLLQLYTDNKRNLLKSVTTTMTQRYNDTPQDGGDWLDDRHSTTITQEEQSSDFMPLINRINDIERKYRNLLDSWVMEYEELLGGGEFIYG